MTPVIYKFPTTRSQFNFLYFLHKTIFLPYNWLATFSCRHLTDIKTLLTQNLPIMKILTPSIVHVPRHNIHAQLYENATGNTKTSTLTVRLLNQIERIRRIVTAQWFPKKPESLFELHWKISSYVSGLSVCIFVALYVWMFVAGANKVEGTMSWCVRTNQILASNR